MKRFKGVLIFSIFVILTSLLVLIWNGIHRKSLNLVVREGLKKADIHIGEFSFFQNSRLGKEWELKAKKAELFESEKRASLEEIQVIIHTEKGVEISFQGEKGTVDTQQKNFHLANSVNPIRITMNNGYVIEVMEVDWNNERKEIVSASPVSIHGENWDIRGRGLILKTKSEEMIIQREIEARVNS